MKMRNHLDLVLITLVLMVVNAPLFTGGSTDGLAYATRAVESGDWWRLLTHPLAHVSIYHFALDAIGFLCLYAALPIQSVARKLCCVAICGASSLLCAVVFSPHIMTAGLRGLSGIDHGLMATSALLMWQNAAGGTTDCRFGAAAFFVVAGKSMLECASGHVFLSQWHMGSVGLPIVETHAGGVLGGILAFRVLATTGKRSGSTGVNTPWQRCGSPA